MHKHQPPKIAFFGSSEFSIFILEEMAKVHLLPTLLITQPDMPKGRKLLLTPPATKTWAEKYSIPVFQPEHLGSEAVQFLKEKEFDLFIVASYGKIIPKAILDIPKHQTLNVHPSLLPKLRGSSPLQTAILSDEKNTGVSIIVLDEKMDHGPIVAMQQITIPNWPPRADVLEKILATEGGKILAKIIPEWMAGKVKAEEQDHKKATFTKKISKEDGCIDLAADPYSNYRKFQAHYGWPGSYFFAERGGKKIRVIIKEVGFENNEFTLKRVLPEGKKEMDYADFERSK